VSDPQITSKLTSMMHFMIEIAANDYPPHTSFSSEALVGDALRYLCLPG